MARLLLATIFLSACAIGSNPADEPCDCPSGTVCGTDGCEAADLCADVVCAADEVCEFGACVIGTTRPLDECQTDADCPQGRCDEGACFDFECAEGATETEDCELGGTRERDCTGGRWAAWTTCPEVSEVQIAATVDGDLAVGVPVLVHAMDGTLLFELETDEAGVALYTVPAETMVTVVFPAGVSDPRQMVSLVGVAPGDSLEMARPSSGTSGEPSGSARITLPGPFEGATDYDVTLGCVGVTVTEPANPIDLEVLEACETGGAFHMLATAFTEDAAVAWSWVRSAALVPDTVVELTPSAWSGASQSRSVSLANVPAQAVDHRVHAGLRLQGRTYGTRGAIGGDGPAPEGTHTFALAAGFDEDTIRTSVNLTLGPHDLPHAWYSYVEEGREDVAIDFAASPSISDGRIDLSFETPRLFWAAAGGSADATYVRITWSAADLDHNWRVTLSPDATEFEFPQLPSGFEARAPASVGMTAAFAYRLACSDADGWNDARVQGCAGFGLAAAATPLDAWHRQYAAWDFEL